MAPFNQRNVGQGVRGALEYDLPTWLYHPSRPARVCRTVEEVELLLAEGWHNEPFPKKGVLPEEFAFMDLAQLANYAKDSMGLKVPPKIRLETLQAKVAAALDTPRDSGEEE
jgi:hypothetical protein